MWEVMMKGKIKNDTQRSSLADLMDVDSTDWELGERNRHVEEDDQFGFGHTEFEVPVIIYMWKGIWAWDIDLGLTRL